MGIDVSSLAAQIGADLAQIQNRASNAGLPSPAAAMDGEHDGGSFADSMKAAIHSVNAQDKQASDRMADVDSGRSDDLVGAMVASQQAELSFSMLMQVRNKVVGAVDELLKLQL